MMNEANTANYAASKRKDYRYVRRAGIQIDE